MEALLRSWFDHAVHAVHPRTLMRKCLSLDGDVLIVETPRQQRRVDLAAFDRVVVTGYGKASVDMAIEVERLLGDRVESGFVVTKETEAPLPDRVEVLFAAHPVPDTRSIEAGRRMLEFVRAADASTLIINLVSGGGSALLEDSVLPLEALQELTDALLRSGASIQELNTVRRHLSRVKGGKLAEAMWPASSVSLVISDVIGDSLENIASGPTVQDCYEVERSHEVLTRYVPPLYDRISEHLRSERISDEVFARADNLVVGNNSLAVAEIVRLVEAEGIPHLVLGSRMCGEARHLGSFYAALAESIVNDGVPAAAPFCVVAGGESTVTVKGKGKGGRSQELALGFVDSVIKSGVDFSRVYLLSAGSDGRDGPTDAAGVCVGPALLEQARDLHAAKYLEENDSYRFFRQLDGLVQTGATGTNVCDLHILLATDENFPEAS